jgi:hypothetical protein
MTNNHVAMTNNFHIHNFLSPKYLSLWNCIGVAFDITLSNIIPETS